MLLRVKHVVTITSTCGMLSLSAECVGLSGLKTATNSTYTAVHYGHTGSCRNIKYLTWYILMYTYIILHRQLITNKPVVQTVADLKVVVVFLHLVLDLLIQEAQFHHEDQACHAGKPVPPHLGIPQHKQHPSDHLTNTICLHYNSIYSTSASSPQLGSCIQHSLSYAGGA